MKKILKLASLFALLSGLMASCGDPVVNDVLTAPTGLTVGTLSSTTAELSWTAVDSAEKYYVVIGDMTPMEVTSPSCEATGLTSETTYNWKVRAAKGDIESEWSLGSDFTTLKGVVPAPTDLNAVDITHETAKLTWEHPGADSHEVVIDNREPVTVTTLSCDVSGLTPVSVCTWKVRSSKNGVWSEWAENKFTTGEVAIYMGTLTKLHEMTYYADAFKNGTVDGWLLTASGPNVSVSGGQFKGNGWVFLTQIHAPLNSGRPMPDGDYRITNDFRSWTALGGYMEGTQRSGTWIIRVENDVEVESVNIISGTLSSTCTNGSYTIRINALEMASGLPVFGTIRQGPASGAPDHNRL
jgi:hypothetical protein